MVRGYRENRGYEGEDSDDRGRGADRRKRFRRSDEGVFGGDTAMDGYGGSSQTPGFGDGYGRPSGQRSYSERAPVGHSIVGSEETTGKVKFFNKDKGFGFVDLGGRDAFLHVSALGSIEGWRLKPGVTITAMVGNGSRGLQVETILTIDESTASEQPDRRRVPASQGDTRPPLQEVEGTVKWYNDNKGYGFIVPDDGGKDVFVHVAKLGGMILSPDERVSMGVAEDSSGRREAKRIRRI